MVRGFNEIHAIELNWVGGWSAGCSAWWCFLLPYGDTERESPRALVGWLMGWFDGAGLFFPGINRLNYNGTHWPESVITLCDRGDPDQVGQNDDID